jgi:hypothetical protein
MTIRSTLVDIESMANQIKKAVPAHLATGWAKARDGAAHAGLRQAANGCAG